MILPQGDLICTLKEEGVVSTTVKGKLHIVCGVVLQEWVSRRGAHFGEGKGPVVPPFKVLLPLD